MPIELLLYVNTWIYMWLLLRYLSTSYVRLESCQRLCCIFLSFSNSCKQNELVYFNMYLHTLYVCCIWTPTNNVYNTSCTTMATMCAAYVNLEKKLSFRIDLTVKNTHNLDHNSFSNENFYSNWIGYVCPLNCINTHFNLVWVVRQCIMCQTCISLVSLAKCSALCAEE